MSDLIIRRAVPADAIALAAFAARTFSDTFAGDNQPAHMREYLAGAFGERQQAAEIKHPLMTTLLAERAGTLRGFAQIHRGNVPAAVGARAAIELHRLYLDHADHGSGLAQSLMTELRAVAAGLGAEHLWLSVWERNARAIAFYRRQGFIDVGETFFMLGPDRQTDRLMCGQVSHPLRASGPIDQT